MRISGFTMAKNAAKLYYPLRESILSILPIVDEYVIALGDNDADDDSLQQIERIQSPKIKVVRTVWDIVAFPNGTENAHQTDIARQHCSGDVLFYLQADEVVHEKDHACIMEYCERLHTHASAEALLFDYLHFWGDYNHHQIAHGWYKKEIRIIKNKPDIHSWESAQSFRRIPGFEGKNYRQQEGTYKLKVLELPVNIYHYGWVRPPAYMQRKNKSLDSIHKGSEAMDAHYKTLATTYDYGPLGRAKKFNGTHPAVMKERIATFNWGSQLNYTSREVNANRLPHKHDKLKNRLLTFIEQYLLGGRELMGFKNYELLKD